MRKKISVINYKLGNIASVMNMLSKVGVDGEIVHSENEVLNADSIIIPGVGHFDQGMKNLMNLNLIPALTKFAVELQRPVLGICLGAQLLGNSSEEGSENGLGWINMNCKRFVVKMPLRVPHMGWNEVFSKNQNPFTNLFLDYKRFYFVHSYHMCCSNPDNVYANSIHGAEFTSVVGKENILGVQFHPEKSHINGINLFKEFAKL